MIGFNMTDTTDGESENGRSLGFNMTERTDGESENERRLLLNMTVRTDGESENERSLIQATAKLHDGIPPSSPSLDWNFEPSAIKTGLDPTTNLTIGCHFNDTGSIRYMALGRKCIEEENGYRMAYIANSITDVIYTNRAPAGAVFTGNTNDKTLQMVVEYPTAADACIYLCHAQQGPRGHFWAYLDIDETQTTLKEMVDAIEDEQEHLTVLDDQVSALQAAIFGNASAPYLT